MASSSEGGDPAGVDGNEDDAEVRDDSADPEASGVPTGSSAGALAWVFRLVLLLLSLGLR